MKNKIKNYGYTLGEMMVVLAIVAVTITLAASFMKFMTMIVTNTYTAKKAILDADLFQRFIKGNIRSYMLLPNKTVSYANLYQMESQGYFDVKYDKDYNQQGLVPCAMIITKYVKYDTDGDANTQSLTTPTVDAILFYVKTAKSPNKKLERGNSGSIMMNIGGAGGTYTANTVRGTLHGWELNSFTPDVSQCKDGQGNPGIAMVDYSPAVNLSMMFDFPIAPYRDLAVHKRSDDTNNFAGNTINTDISLMRNARGMMPSLNFENQTDRTASRNDVAALTGLALGLSFGVANNGDYILNIKGSDTNTYNYAQGKSWENIHSLPQDLTNYIGSGLGGIAASHFIATQRYIIGEQCDSIAAQAVSKITADGRPLAYDYDGSVVVYPVPTNGGLVCEKSPLCTISNTCWRPTSVVRYKSSFKDREAYTYLAPPGFFITKVQYWDDICDNSNVTCDSAQCERAINYQHGELDQNGWRSCYKKTSVGPWGSMSTILVRGWWGDINQQGFAKNLLKPKNKMFATDADIIGYTATDQDFDNDSFRKEPFSGYNLPIYAKAFVKRFRSEWRIDSDTSTGQGDSSCDNWKPKVYGYQFAYIKAVWLSNDVLDVPSLPTYPAYQNTATGYSGGICTKLNP